MAYRPDVEIFLEEKTFQVDGMMDLILNIHDAVKSRVFLEGKSN
jgi:hypothetical protein